MSETQTLITIYTLMILETFNLILPNLILSFTNINAIFAIYNYYYCQKYIQMLSITSIMIISIFYHLIEHHKHNMPGIGILNSKFYHNIFLNLDRLFSVIAIITCYDPIIFSLDYILFIIIALISMFIAENIAKTVPVYVLTHSIWHLSVFEIARWLSLNC